MFKMKCYNQCYLKALFLLQYFIKCSCDQGYSCWSQKVLGDCVCYGDDEKICSAHAFDRECIGQIQVLKTINYNVVDLTSSMFDIKSFDNIKCDKLLTNRFIPNKTVDTIFSKAMSKVNENVLYIQESTMYLLENLFKKGAPNVRELIINQDMGSLPSFDFENLPNLEVFKLDSFDSPSLKPRVFFNLRHLKKLEIYGSGWWTLLENSLVFQSENMLHVDFSGTPIELEDLKRSNLSNDPGGLVANLEDTWIEHFPQDVFERFFKKNSNIELNLDDNRIICSYKENKWIFDYEERTNENFPVKNVKCINYGSKNLLLMDKCEFEDYDKINTDCSPATNPSTHLTTNKLTDKTNPKTKITTSTPILSTSPISLSTSKIPLSSSTISSTTIKPIHVEKVNVLQNYLIFIILGVIFILMVILRLYFYLKKYFSQPNNQEMIRRARGSSSSDLINSDYNTSSNYLTQSQINARNIYSRVRKYLRIFHFNESLDRPLPQIESSNQKIYSIDDQMDSPEEHIYETINYNTIYETIE